MTRWMRGAALLLASWGSASAQGRSTLPYRDPRLPTEARVRDLLGRMTPDEKFWQLFMIPGDLDDSSHDYTRGIFGLQIGVHDTTPARAARAHALRINAIQRYFVERTRLGIPIIPFEEAVHGLARPGATVFPQAIALAATWDTGLVSRVADAIARETRSRGIRQVLSPVVNIASDVRWGRVEETYGEDPLLASLMGAAFDKPTGRGDDYLDLTGQALFPFGFGLSYTRFEYSNLEIEPGFVRCRVKNVGDRAGDEVVQLYLHNELASVAQPVIALKGFTRIQLRPGEEGAVTFRLGPDGLRLLDRDLHWVVEPRTVRVMVGASSKDIRLRGMLTVR